MILILQIGYDCAGNKTKSSKSGKKIKEVREDSTMFNLKLHMINRMYCLFQSQQQQQVTRMKIQISNLI